MSGQIKYKTAEKYFLGGNSPDEGVSAFTSVSEKLHRFTPCTTASERAKIGQKPRLKRARQETLFYDTDTEKRKRI